MNGTKRCRENYFQDAYKKFLLHCDVLRAKKCKCDLLVHDDRYIHDIMHQELEDYVDDIVVKSRRRKDYVKVLRTFFERCRLFKLRMNALKCAFGVSAGKFLGVLVHSKGIDVDPAKAVTIATMKPPTTVKALKRFLGKVSYIRRFIPSLASITSTFTKLLKKGQGFIWGEAQQAAFWKL